MNDNNRASSNFRPGYPFSCDFKDTDLANTGNTVLIGKMRIGKSVFPPKLPIIDQALGDDS